MPKLIWRSTTRRIFEEHDHGEASHEEDIKIFKLGFHIEHYFMLGSPLGLFVSVYSEESFIKE